MPRAKLKGCIITLMGPVGVGKSTQSRLIGEYLKRKKIITTTTFIKSSHGLSLILNRILLKPGVHVQASHETHTRVRKLYRLYYLLDAVSIVTKFFFKVYLPYRLGFVVLIEEGLIMTLYTYRSVFPRWFGAKPTSPPFILSLLAYMTSKHHISIFLDASLEELDRRRKHRSFRQTESTEYVNMQKKWIRRAVQSGYQTYGSIVSIDTSSMSVKKTHKAILKVLKAHMHENPA